MKKMMAVAVAVPALMALAGCGLFRGNGGKTPVVGERVPILVSESTLTPDRTIAEVGVLVPPPAVNAEWTQPGGNASKSMGHPALGETLSRAWTVSIPGGSTRVRLAAAPVVADGKLFVTDVAGAVHALSADTGAELWRTDTAKGNENRDARFGGGVSYEAGKLYATNGLGDVVALNAADGAELWRAKPGGPLRGAPTLANGNAYVLSQDNQLFAVSQADGKVVWTASATLETQGVFGAAAPAVGQGTVIAGFSSGELNAYRYENGRSLWQDTLSRTTISTSVAALADIDAEPVIDQGRVYAVGQGGRMVALEVVSGQRLWEQNLGGISTPWVAGEWLFVLTDEAKLICIARGSGRVRWIAQLRQFRNQKGKKGPIGWVGPVLAGNRLLAMSSRGEIVPVAIADGAIGTAIEGDGVFTLPPVVANNTLYVMDDKGRISAYR